MPVANILDCRSCKYDVNVDVVFEPSFHDNTADGATQFEDDGPELDEGEFEIDELVDTTVSKAIEYAKKFSIPVTVFLYDKGFRPLMPPEEKLEQTGTM